MNDQGRVANGPPLILTICGDVLMIRKTYRSEDGRHLFCFGFDSNGDTIDVSCTRYPPLNGQDSSVHKTHLYSSGQLCFVSGREPRSRRRAEELAKQWAEYWLEYRRTGVAQA